MSERDALPLDTFRSTMFCPLGGWRDKSGLTLTATTEPDLIAMGTTQYGIKWDHGGTTTDYAAFDFIMPHEFGENAPPAYDIKLVVVARKWDTSADENADLALQCQCAWFTPGVLSNPRQSTLTATAPTLTTAAGSGKILTTPAKALMAGAAIIADNTVMTGFARYELDIGARLRAESLTMNAGDVVQLRLSPNEVVGATDMDLEIIGAPALIIRRENQIVDRFTDLRNV